MLNFFDTLFNDPVATLDEIEEQAYYYNEPNEPMSETNEPNEPNEPMSRKENEDDVQEN